jgi:hypothetical protein
MESEQSRVLEDGSRGAVDTIDGPIKTFLVPVSGSETDRTVLSAALSLARPLQAHLKFIHQCLSGPCAVSRPLAEGTSLQERTDD